MLKSFMKHSLFDILIMTVDSKPAGRVAIAEEKHVENAGDFLKVSSTWRLSLQVEDQDWTQLPVIAADLYKHQGDIGYMSPGAALAAAKDILKAKGWIDTSREESE